MNGKYEGDKMDLANKVVLVTGASRGIGESICLKLLEKGAIVYGTSRKESKLYPFTMIRSDVTDPEECRIAVEKVLKAEGRIDVFINNAGAGLGGAIEDTDPEESKWQFEVNFFGMMNMLHHIIPVMRKQNGGRIVLIGSAAGFLAVPYQGLYTATKYAVEGIGLALMNELRSFNVRVMLVNPGDTKTGFTENRVFAKNAGSGSAYYDKFAKSIKKMERSEINGMDPAVLARGVVKRLERKRLCVRYVPGMYRAVFFISRILPERLVLFLMYKLYL
jgi:short-subunit dehydrogenase